MTIRLSDSNLAGTERTLVAVGTARLAVMLVTVRAAAPRSLLTSASGMAGAAGGCTPACAGPACGAGAACAGAACGPGTGGAAGDTGAGAARPAGACGGAWGACGAGAGGAGGAATALVRACAVMTGCGPVPLDNAGW